MKKSSAIIIFILLTLIVGAQNPSKNVILNEGFEEGIPSSWSFYQLGSNPSYYEWSIDGHSYTGAKSIFHRSQINTEVDTWMVIPQITVTSNDFYLSFWEAIHEFSNYHLHEIIISTGSGDPSDGDFTDVIYTIPDDGYEIYSEVVLSLDDYEGEDIYIAFRYQNPLGQWSDQWHIDDVMVVETNLSHDLACVKMNPVYHASLETPCNPKVTVKNFGNSMESSYSINLTIEGTSYDETVVVDSDLSVLQENIIGFPDWIPTESGIYTLNATVILSNDENPDNNSHSVNCEAFSPDDYSKGTVYSIEYAPTKDAVDSTISLNTETGEKIYMSDHDFIYPYRLAAMTYMEGKIIAVQRDVCDVFVVTPSGSFIRTGNIPNVFYINGIAYDEVSQTLYAVGLEDDAIEDYLYTIDENWLTTEVMPIPQKMFIYGLAANSLGELFGIATMDGSLFAIDPVTQQTEDIGIIDGLQNGMQIQDIGFDRNNDILYGTLAVANGQVFTKIDTKDASLDIIQNYGYESPFGSCAPIPGTVTKIVTHNSESLTVYPNPANKFINIKSQLDIFKISIINSIGQIIVEERVYKPEFNIDVSKFDPGLYIINLETEEDTIIKKIVVR